MDNCFFFVMKFYFRVLYQSNCFFPLQVREVFVAVLGPNHKESVEVSRTLDALTGYVLNYLMVLLNVSGFITQFIILLLCI